MANQFVASMLKNARIDNNITIKQVIETLLTKYKIHVASKTLYGWEAGRSQPDIDTFVALCEIYNIEIENFSKLGKVITDNNISYSKDTYLSPSKKSLIADLEKMSDDELIAVRAFVNSLETVKKSIKS